MLLCLKLTMELEHVNWDHMEICLDIQNEWYATQSNIVVSFAIRTDDSLYIFLCWPQFNSQHQSSSTIFICNVSMLAEPHTCARLLSHTHGDDESLNISFEWHRQAMNCHTKCKCTLNQFSISECAIGLDEG